MNPETFQMRSEIELQEDWRSWLAKIPFLNFPSSWNVQIIPPFAGALIRFRVWRTNSDFVSIYLDVFNNLGCMEGPYWEVYPVDGDAIRCPMNDITTLKRLIAVALKEAYK